MGLDGRCTICRSELELVSLQPIDDQYEMRFLKCSLCGKAYQVVVESDFTRKPDE
jgi:transcription elongation factor Elf1